MSWLLIALGAGFGAPARYLTDRAIQSRYRTAFPWGTLTVNVVASLVLGIVAGAGSRFDADLTAVVGTGFCGALSTYSAFGYETLRLTQHGRRGYGLATVAVSLVAGIGVAALGWAIGARLG